MRAPALAVALGVVLCLLPRPVAAPVRKDL